MLISIFIFIIFNMMVNEPIISNSLMYVMGGSYPTLFIQMLNRNKILLDRTSYKTRVLSVINDKLIESSKIFKKGTVVDYKGGTTFVVKLDACDKRLLCDLAGRLVKRRVRISINTKVKIELNLLFPERGRIVERYSIR